jgi:sulfate adenylyltransferase subunit 1
LRLPVQYVARPTAGHPRRYLGRVESGSVAAGDEVIVLPSGRSTRVREIRHHDGPLPRAGLHASVALVLDDEIDVSRGDMIVRPGELPRPASRLEADVCWLADTPLDPLRPLVLRHTTREVRARVERIDWQWDVTTQTRQPGTRALATNDIARVALALAQPVFIDPYGDHRATGSFVLIDEVTNNSVAAGMVVA